MKLKQFTKIPMTLAAEVNKVAKPANLVGRKLFGSLGLTENISWKSRNFDVNISKLFSFLKRFSVKFYIIALSAFLVCL